MTYTQYRKNVLWSAIGYALTAALLSICMARAELPMGMHLEILNCRDYLTLVDPDPVLTTRHRRVSDTVIIDTLWRPGVTPNTRALDSLDSIIAVIKKRKK